MKLSKRDIELVKTGITYGILHTVDSSLWETEEEFSEWTEKETEKIFKIFIRWEDADVG